MNALKWRFHPETKQRYCNGCGVKIMGLGGSRIASARREHFHESLDEDTLKKKGRRATIRAHAKKVKLEKQKNDHCTATGAYLWNFSPSEKEVS